MRILRVALVMSCVVGLVVGLTAQSGGKQFVPPASGQDGPFSGAVKAGGAVYASSMMATDVRGDITAQTRQIFQNLQGVLKQAGSSVDNIAVATVTLQQVRDLAALDEAFRAQFRGDPPARTVAYGNTGRPGALVEIGVIAVPTGGERRAILPPGWKKPSGAYSYAMQSGDTLYLSAVAPLNMQDLSTVRGDIERQAITAMNNASELLGAAGMSLDDTVSSRVSLRYRIDDFQNFNNAYGRYWDVRDPRATGAVPGRPGRAAVGLSPIGAHDVEITFTAVKGSSPREIVIPPNPDGSPGRLGPRPYSPAIRVGNRLWVQGTTGGTRQNMSPERSARLIGNVKAQVKENLTRLTAPLRAGGFDFKDVVMVEVWMTNVAMYREMNEAMREFFPTDPPVRIRTTGVETLGGGTALTEIALTAVK